jgi:hypothetical protein
MNCTDLASDEYNYPIHSRYSKFSGIEIAFCQSLQKNLLHHLTRFITC